jgi:hypothetical protein
VAILAELFVESRDPTYVFNQARCFQQNGHNREAIDRFREYLRIASDADKETVVLAGKYIDDCQALLDAGAERAAVPTPVPAPAVAPVQATRSEAAGIVARPQTDVVEASSAASSAGTPGGGLRSVGTVAVALGGAGLITGVVLNVKVNSMASDLEAPGAYSRGGPGPRPRSRCYRPLRLTAWVGFYEGGSDER